MTYRVTVAAGALSLLSNAQYTYKLLEKLKATSIFIILVAAAFQFSDFNVAAAMLILF